MKAVLKNPRTGELRKIKVGFSWVLFLLSSLVGIPLFLRRLYLLGALMIVVNIASSSIMNSAAEANSGPGVLLGLGIQIAYLLYLGIKGNELTAKSLLDKGWVFAKPDSPEAQQAAARWSIELPTAATTQPAAGV